MDRDVVGYLTARRMEGPWDNFQCRQLAENAAAVEIAKIIMHAAAGAFSLPRRYTFVALMGIGRSLQQLVAHPERFRKSVVDSWDAKLASRLADGQTIPLSPAIEAQAAAFDFKEVHWLDAAKLAGDPSCMPALVKWFGADPGASPRGVVPDHVQSVESPYVGQLLGLYEKSGPYATVHPLWGDNPKDTLCCVPS